MRLIIAGSRMINSQMALHDAMTEWMRKQTDPIEITEVVCGMARGADMVGRHWALASRIPVKEFPADWEKHGKAAGFLRNYEMAKYADALLALWDGKSRGTAHMISAMKFIGKPVFVYRIQAQEDVQ